jgi:hypothetical protein
MKNEIISIAVGCLSGLAGVLIGSSGLTGHEAPAPERIQAAAPKIITPPGWEARIASNEPRFEAKPVSKPEPKAVPKIEPSAGEDARDPIKDREALREEHYEEELLTQERYLLDHQQEERDAAWSGDAERSLREAIEPSLRERSASVKTLDCRSKTCVAELTFKKPQEALEYLYSRGVSLTRNLHGLAATPVPPSGDGAYDLTIVLFR